MSISSWGTAYVVFACGALALNTALPWAARRHFVPEQMMARLAGRDPATVLIGNSLLAAGYRDGEGSGVANFAIGATGPWEHRMVLRQVLERHHPKRLVYGWAGDQLLPHELVPSEIVGNRLVAVTWARPSDVFDAFPGFPRAHAIDGITFAAMTQVSLLSYGRLLQSKIEVRRRALAQAETAASEFGAVDDFQRLAAAEGERLPARLAAHRHGDRFDLDRDVLAIREMARSRGMSIVWVAMPLSTARRALTLRVPGYREYLAFAEAALAGAGDLFLDATELTGSDDTLYQDGMHLGGDGVRRFTAWLDEKIGTR
jgi:hypothetical protein